MKIYKRAVAGTMESSDVFVEINPSEEALAIDIQSVVSSQFGEQIKTAVIETLKEFDVTQAQISLYDRGALDCTIRARVETAVRRAGKELE
ncbi:MAG: citrate lyase acyl carrier protein [Lachnospiraceae bacterium]